MCVLFIDLFQYYIHPTIRYNDYYIPDCIYLSRAMESLIRKHGWADKDIEEIPLEAAIALGRRMNEAKSGATKK